MQVSIKKNIPVIVVLAMVLITVGCQKKEALYVDKGYMYFAGNATYDQFTPTPAVPSGGTAALTARYDNNSKIFNYFLTWKGMAGLVTRADFYFPSSRTQNGLLERNMFNFTTPWPADSTYAGQIWTNTWLSEKEVEDLKAGKVYFNIRTQANTGGEIRGYIQLTEDKTQK